MKEKHKIFLIRILSLWITQKEMGYWNGILAKLDYQQY